MLLLLRRNGRVWLNDVGDEIDCGLRNHGHSLRNHGRCSLNNDRRRRRHHHRRRHRWSNVVVVCTGLEGRNENNVPLDLENKTSLIVDRHLVRAHRDDHHHHVSCWKTSDNVHDDSNLHILNHHHAYQKTGSNHGVQDYNRGEMKDQQVG